MARNTNENEKNGGGDTYENDTENEKNMVMKTTPKMKKNVMDMNKDCEMVWEPTKRILRRLSTLVFLSTYECVYDYIHK